MNTDRYGLELSTASVCARDHYVAGVDLLLALQPGADLEFEAALAADPTFAMAHAAMARLHQTWGRAAQARTSIAAAAALTSSVSTRERQHIVLLATLLEGNSAQALRRLLEHLDDYPRDALALGLALGAFGLLAFSGRPDHDAVRLGLSERTASAYGDDWWFLSHLAWAHVESGSLMAGEKYIERSLAIKADNANAIHVYAHLAYEQNRAAEAVSRINSLTANYSGNALLHNHLRWHCALGELKDGRADTALAAYDRYLDPDVATAPLITAMTDAVSLLWRLELATGRSAGIQRWAKLRDFIVTRNYQSTVAFLDVHVATLYSMTGEHAAFDALLSQLDANLRAKRLPAGPAVIDLCNALRAFAAHDPENSDSEDNVWRAISLLETNLGNIVRIGGSGAQRDLFEETLAAAHRRSDNVSAVTFSQTWQKVRASSLIQD